MNEIKSELHNCPKCGSKMHRAEYAYYESGGWQFKPRMICRKCGHKEKVGSEKITKNRTLGDETNA